LKQKQQRTILFSQHFLCKGFSNYPYFICNTMAPTYKPTPFSSIYPRTKPTSLLAPSSIPIISPSISSSPEATPLHFQLTLNTYYCSSKTLLTLRIGNKREISCSCKGSLHDANTTWLFFHSCWRWKMHWI